MQTQIEFEFHSIDRVCRTCLYAQWATPIGGWHTNRIGGEGRIKFGCGTSQFKSTYLLTSLPPICGVWEKGREKMSYVDLRKLSEEQLRAELEKIRVGRCKIGRNRRMESRERRVSDGSAKERKQKEVSADAEWV